MNIMQIGIKDSQPKWLQQRIKATNSVFSILSAILVLLFISSLIFATQIMTIAVSISVLIVAGTIWMHSLGFHLFSRLLVSTLPVFVSSCIQGAYQMDNQLPNASAWVFIMGFQVLPFLLFDPIEKSLRRITICTNLVVAGCYSFFNQWIELAQAPLTPPVQVFTTIIIGLVLIVGLLNAMDSIFVKTNKENRDLLKSVEREREEQEIAQEKLNKTLEELNKSKVEEAKRIWNATGTAEVVRIMHESEDLVLILDRVLIYLVKRLVANQAALFLIEGEKTQEVLELKSCYAYERKKYLNKQIAIGEGLVGQCYLEREFIYLLDVPEDYIRIGSGLGDSKPTSILLVPIQSNNEIYGVFEIASFKEFQRYEIDFLLEVGENIAMTIRSIRSSEQTQTLLYQTQAMTEQMKDQEDIMRQNMESIMVDYEELMRKEEELKNELRNKDEQILLLQEKLQTAMTGHLQVTGH